MELLKNIRGQLKIQQMAFMLIAVTLFFVFVGLFVLMVVFSGVKESSQLIQNENAMLLVSKLSGTPEFSCGEAFQTSRIKCVDLDKVRALKENIGKYRDFWGVEEVEIVRIYPEGDKISVLSSSSGEGIGISDFVSLCETVNENNEIYPKCGLGKLMVRYVQK